MGRRWPLTVLISLGQAAALLKVSEAAVRSWARKGVLEEVGTDAGPVYREDQVESLGRYLPDGVADLGVLAARADLAYVKSVSVERRLDELVDLLGLRRNTLDLHEGAVRALADEVDEAMLEVEPPSVETVRKWAGTFFSIDEAYLLVAEKYLHTSEPWKKYMDLGYRLAAEAPAERFDREPEYRPAYGYLAVARQQLRMAAYFYCRGERGREMAEQIFGEGRVTERILGLLYPH